MTTATTTEVEHVSSHGHRHLGWALVLISVAQLMVVLDATIANIALPYIQADLDFSENALPWIVTANSLTFGGFLLLGGRTGDLYGRRRDATRRPRRGSRRSHRAASAREVAVIVQEPTTRVPS